MVNILNLRDEITGRELSDLVKCLKRKIEGHGSIHNVACNTVLELARARFVERVRMSTPNYREIYVATSTDSKFDVAVGYIREELLIPRENAYNINPETIESVFSTLSNMGFVDNNIYDINLLRFARRLKNSLNLEKGPLIKVTGFENDELRKIRNLTTYTAEQLGGDNDHTKNAVVITRIDRQEKDYEAFIKEMILEKNRRDFELYEI